MPHPFSLLNINNKMESAVRTLASRRKWIKDKCFLNGIRNNKILLNVVNMSKMFWLYVLLEVFHWQYHNRFTGSRDIAPSEWLAAAPRRVG